MTQIIFKYFTCLKYFLLLKFYSSTWHRFLRYSRNSIHIFTQFILFICSINIFSDNLSSAIFLCLVKNNMSHIPTEKAIDRIPKSISIFYLILYANDSHIYLNMDFYSVILLRMNNKNYGFLVSCVKYLIEISQKSLKFIFS